MFEKENSLENLVSTIAGALVDNPKAISVKTVEGSASGIIELSVAQEDIGKVIGKQGRMADAIRTIISGVTGRGKKKYSLQIMG